MGSQAYDPRTFLGKYTQRPEGGLPIELQSVTQGYLGPYEWYDNLLREVETTGEAASLKELPLSTFVDYLEILLQDGQTAAVTSLVNLATRYEIYPREILSTAAEKGYLATVVFINPPSDLRYTESYYISKAANNGHLRVAKYLILKFVNKADINNMSHQNLGFPWKNQRIQDIAQEATENGYPEVGRELASLTAEKLWGKKVKVEGLPFSSSDDK